MNKIAGMIAMQRFDILFKYKILVIHIVSKVFNRTVKKYLEDMVRKQKSFITRQLLFCESNRHQFFIFKKTIFA